MQEKTLSIPTISCGHCIMAIKNELNEIEGVKDVTGSPQNKNITVKWDPPATLDNIKSALKEINYPVV